MLLLLYNRYKARLISFTAELPFVRLNLVKHKLKLWKADYLTIPVASCISGTVSSNKNQYLDWCWTSWKMKTSNLGSLPCITGSCIAAQRFRSTQKFRVLKFNFNIFENSDFWKVQNFENSESVWFRSDQKLTSPKNYFANSTSRGFVLYFKLYNEEYDSNY